MSNPFNWQNRPNNSGNNGAPNNNGGRGSNDFVEEIRVSGKNLVGEVERLLKETEVRRLRIRQDDKILLDIPVAWAALGVIIAPILAAVGAIASVVTNCTIEVTRAQPSQSSSAKTPPARPTAPAPAKPAATPTDKKPNNWEDASHR